MVAPVCRVANTSPCTSSNSPNPNMNPSFTPVSASSISRGRTTSQENTVPPRESSMESCSSSSSVEDYALKVAREAEMDVDSDITPNRSWADQVNDDQPSAKESCNSMPTHEENTTTLACPPQHPQLHGTAHEHVDPAPGTPVVIPYNENYPANPALWDGDFAQISIFGTRESFLQDATNITTSLKCVATYIRQTNLSKGDPNTLPQLDLFGNAAWDLISAIYKSNWDQLQVDNGISFQNKVAGQFNQGERKFKAQSVPQDSQTCHRLGARMSLEDLSPYPPPSIARSTQESQG